MRIVNIYWIWYLPVRKLYIEVKMELLIRISQSDVPLSGFERENETVETISDGLFVRMEEYNEDLLIPKEIRSLNFTLYIQVEERWASSFASVVCGILGKPLTPYPCPAFGSIETGVQAYFFAPISVVTVTSRCKSDEVVIIEYRGVKKGELAWIQERVIYTGDGETLPSNISYFKEAGRMARKKANCLGCRHVHFKKET